MLINLVLDSTHSSVSGKKVRWRCKVAPKYNAWAQENGYPLRKSKTLSTHWHDRLRRKIEQFAEQNEGRVMRSEKQPKVEPRDSDAEIDAAGSQYGRRPNDRRVTRPAEITGADTHSVSLWQERQTTTDGPRRNLSANVISRLRTMQSMYQGSDGQVSTTRPVLLQDDEGGYHLVSPPQRTREEKSTALPGQGRVSSIRQALRLAADRPELKLEDGKERELGPRAPEHKQVDNTGHESISESARLLMLISKNGDKNAAT